MPLSAMRAAALGWPLLLLPACASGSQDDLVWIEVSGDQTCLVQAEGALFTLPGQEMVLKAHLQRLAQQAGGALVGAEPDRTSLACWAAATLATRNVGFRRVGLLAFPEPPPVD